MSGSGPQEVFMCVCFCKHPLNLWHVKIKPDSKKWTDRIMSVTQEYGAIKFARIS